MNVCRGVAETASFGVGEHTHTHTYTASALSVAQQGKKEVNATRSSHHDHDFRPLLLPSRPRPFPALLVLLFPPVGHATAAGCAACVFPLCCLPPPATSSITFLKTNKPCVPVCPFLP